MTKSPILVVVCAGIAACGGGEPEKPREPTVGSEIASGYNRQMMRAQQVEVQLDQQKHELDAAIEASDPGRQSP
jgi:hypothetical protein